MGPSIAILLLVCGGAALLIVGVLNRSEQRTIEGRIDLLKGAAVAPQSVAEIDAAPSRQEVALGWLQALFTFRMRYSWGVTTRPLYLLAIGIVSAVVLWVVIAFATRLTEYTATVVAIVALYAVPRLIVFREQVRADRQFGELLPDAIDMVVRIVRAGMPVAAAVRVVAQEANPPLNGVFARVADQASIGMPFDEALARIAKQIGNPDFRFFAVAVSLQQITGGNLAATLESLSEIIRRRRAVIMKAHAASAEVRMSAWVLGAIPVFVTGALLMVAPTYLNVLFTDRRGEVIFGLAVFLLLAAGVTMRSMIRNALQT